MSIRKALETAKEYSTIIISVSAVGALILSAFNAYSTYRIAPLVTAIQQVNAATKILETADNRNFAQHDSFVTLQKLADHEKAEETRQNDIIHRLDLISGRLDSLIVKK